MSSSQKFDRLGTVAIHLALGLASLSCSMPPLQTYDGANLVIIGLDTIRADHLGIYGRSPSYTPEIDVFAEDSIVFENAYSTAPWTLPSFGSLFTGLLPSEHGAVGGQYTQLAPEKVTLAEKLSGAGYQTTGFVAVDWLTESFGMSQGFDRQEVFVKGNVSTRYELYEQSVREFLTEAASESPFFLFVHIYDAHAPYEPLAPFDRMYYAGDPFSESENDLAPLYAKSNRAMREPEKLYRWLEGVQDINYPIQQYAAGVSWVDSKVGALLDVLRETNRFDDSIVVLLADHGEHLTEHDIYFTHFLPYEETLRVPLVIRLPGARHGGKRINDEVSLMDVAPTLLSLLALAPLEEASGLDLSPLIDGSEAALAKRWLFGEWGGPKHTVRAAWNRQFRLLRFEQGKKVRLELYERTTDRAETTDLAQLRPEVTDPLVDLLEGRFLGLDTPGAGALKPGISEEVEQRLKALGYL